MVDKQQQILITQRPRSKSRSGYWEFPGGKIENGETPEQALIRELQEEIGVRPLEFHPMMQYHYDYPEHSALLEVFIINRFEGEPQSLEDQEILWIGLNEFPNFNFLEANQKMIEVLLQKLNY